MILAIYIKYVHSVCWVKTRVSGLIIKKKKKNIDIYQEFPHLFYMYSSLPTILRVNTIIIPIWEQRFKSMAHLTAAIDFSGIRILYLANISQTLSLFFFSHTKQKEVEKTVVRSVLHLLFCLWRKGER